VWLEPHETVKVTETGFSFSPVSRKTASLEKRGKGKVTPKQAYVALRGPGG
jgi:hypothetical protein